MESDIERAASLLLKAEYVTCLTGAGVSVESGIRPFRGPGGLWTEYGEPPMNGYKLFLADPKAHWERQLKREGHAEEMASAFAKAKPNPAHLALAEMERLGVLKYVITQNVDNLHRAAGQKNLAEIHGNRMLLRCIDCGKRYTREEIPITELPPHCPNCRGIVKGDGVMFGEPIPTDVLTVCQEESGRSDCVLLVGTSAVVYPAAAFPQAVKRKGGYLVEVDPYETALTNMCTVSLRGRAGEVLPRLVSSLRRKLEKAV
ncbi:MAG: Sir2 family NAD-dependent protein deacetylase [Chloroflexota bacterium]